MTIYRKLSNAPHRSNARLALSTLEGRCLPASFVVSSVADSGAGSLRAALASANSTIGADTVTFNIAGGPATIALASTLPALTEQITIDATTQPGYAGVPRITLDGAATGAGANGLVFQNDNYGSAVKGLSLVGFGGSAIRTIATSPMIGAGAITIQGNYIGILPDGVTAKGNGIGIWLDSTTFLAENSIIGGSTAGQGNVISGNSTGVYLRSWVNFIVGNLIGTNAAGTVAVPNQVGIKLAGIQNTVGGTNGADGNLISGNSVAGIDVGGSVETSILGNKIGTNLVGTQALPNGVGISVGIAPNVGAGVTSIGGTQPGAGNVIAFNQGPGIAVYAKSFDTGILGNSIFNNGGLGIDLSGAATPDGVSPNGNVGQGYQRPPVVSNAKSLGGGTTVDGTFVGEFNANYRIEFFANSTADASGYGEGATYLGSVNVTSNGSGQGVFDTAVLPAPAGSMISAIASVERPPSNGFMKRWESSEFSFAQALSGSGSTGGSVTGIVFFDANRNGQRDNNEIVEAGVTVFLDTNNDGKLGAGELNVATNSSGAFTLTSTANGSFSVRQLPRKGQFASTTNPVQLSLAGGNAVTLNFGNTSVFVAGSGSGTTATVQVYNPDGSTRTTITPYGSFAGGVRVATGDIDGDGVPEIITAPGPGGGPHVRVFSGTTHLMIREFFAQAANMSSGLFVAAGDVDGDGRLDIITGAGVGIGVHNEPRIRVFNGVSNVMIRDIVAYPDTSGAGQFNTYNVGATVAAADFNGDGKADIVAGPESGNPNILVFSGADTGPAPARLRDFFAYAPTTPGGSQFYPLGAYVAVGNYDGDGTPDIVTGAGINVATGVGGGSHVRVFSGGNKNSITTEFFAYPNLTPEFRGGVRVGAADLDGDGRIELLAAPGVTNFNPVGITNMIRVYNQNQNVYRTFTPFNNFLGGSYVG